MKNPLIYSLVLLAPAFFTGSQTMSGAPWAIFHNEPRDGISAEETGRNYRVGNKITYEWTYIFPDGTSANFSLWFTVGDWHAMQRDYKCKPHRHGNYRQFLRNDPYRRDVMQVARILRQIAIENSIEEVSFALQFVQSLPYQEGMGGYQRYAMETLIDGSGDCSDTSVLFAGILAAWDYSCVFLGFPGHLAVGVWCRNMPSGYYWEYDGRKYYFCETTGTGWEIGSCDNDYKLAAADVDEVYSCDIR